MAKFQDFSCSRITILLLNFQHADQEIVETCEQGKSISAIHRLVCLQNKNGHGKSETVQSIGKVFVAYANIQHILL